MKGSGQFIVGQEEGGFADAAAKWGLYGVVGREIEDSNPVVDGG